MVAPAWDEDWFEVLLCDTGDADDVPQRILGFSTHDDVFPCRFIGRPFDRVHFRSLALNGYDVICKYSTAMVR